MVAIDPTRAAEGWPRRAFTVKDVERMVNTGVIAHDERIELVGGEIVPMAPKGIRHELIKTMLIERWIKVKPDALMLTPETTLRLSELTYLEPDIIVYRRADGLAGLCAETALLVVEIADASLSFDLQKKPEIYATFGVAELWVIDANRNVVHVHRDPSGPDAVPAAHYGDVQIFPADAWLIPQKAPELAIRLADLLTENMGA